MDANTETNTRAAPQTAVEIATQALSPEANGAANTEDKGTAKPAPADGENHDAGDGEVSDNTQARDEKGRFKGLQGRIDELTRARRESERQEAKAKEEAAYWRGQAEGRAPQTPAKDAASTKPDPANYDDYAKYTEDLSEWKADQIVAKRLEGFEAKLTEKQQARALESTWEQKVTAARAEIPDFDEVMASAADIPMTNAVIKALKRSELGPKLAVHLARNPNEIAALNRLQSAEDVMLAVGRIEGRLSAKPTSVRTTKAPEPASHISSSGKTSRTNILEMTPAQVKEAMRQAGVGIFQ